MREQDVINQLYYAEKKGLAEGEAKARCETAKNLLKMGLPAEQIAQATGLSEEEIIKL